jgi:hypothetical protein
MAEQQQFRILETFWGDADRRTCWERIEQYCPGFDPRSQDACNLSYLELEPVTVELTRIKGTEFYLMAVCDNTAP